jgi:hypothetical protein
MPIKTSFVLALSLSACVAACDPTSTYVVRPDDEGLPEESAPTLPSPRAPDAVARGVDEPVDPEPVDPEPVDPEPAEPEPVDPEPVDPEPVDPEPVAPEPVAPLESISDACSHVQVVDTGGASVNVRPTASTSQAPVGVLQIGDVVDVLDVVSGQAIEGVGTTATTTSWARIAGADIEGFVSAAFLTCAVDADTPPACPRVQIVGTGGAGANVRPTSSTAQAPVGALPENTIADVVAVVVGQSVTGTTTWFDVDASNPNVSGFVSGAFASCVVDDAPTHPASAFLLPLPCGMTVTVTQGNNTSFSHNGASAYSFDFGIPSGTPLLAIKDAVVIAVDESTQPGDPCYAGGGQSCINEANGVTLRHPDGTTSLYAHVNSVDVSLGQSVARGQRVATSGGTGWSTGPHAHLQRQTDCGFAFCQSIAMSFADVAGDGVPVSGETVTSQNGCN